tara:strand:+ start:3519 stop:3872 length:354 start_codon:yes stop_codon:yes gene_type:complete
MALSRDAIFNAKDTDVHEFEVPEWGGTILLRSMTGKQRNNYEYWAMIQSKKEFPDYRGIREKLILSCAVDEKGQPLFEEDDLEALAEKNSDVIDRIHEKCREICGMDEDAVEEAAKN